MMQTYFRTNYEINDHEKGDKIIPWATVKGQDWVMPRKNGNYTYLIALPQYHTSTNTNTWDLSRNVSVSTQAILGSDRTINSLRLIGQAMLGLDKFDLTLNSGGLLSYGKNTITSNRGRLMGVQGEFGKKVQRPFYAHIYGGELRIEGRTQIRSDYEFVKTGDGTLLLNSAATHYFGKSLYINQGTLSLRQGRMQVGRQNWQDSIFIASGTALELPVDSWDPIIGSGRAPNIVLNGTPYGPGPNMAARKLSCEWGGIPSCTLTSSLSVIVVRLIGMAARSEKPTSFGLRNSALTCQILNSSCATGISMKISCSLGRVE